MAWAHVQSTNGRSTSGVKSLAFGSNVTAGNLIIVAIMLENTTDTISTVADGLGNTYSVANALLSCAGGLAIATYYAKNILGGACTVTVTPSGTAATNLMIHEYSGLDTVSPLDVINAAAIASGTAMDSGSATTTQDNDLIFGNIGGNRSLTVGSGFAQRQSQVFNQFQKSEDKTATPAGSFSATATMGSSGQGVIQMATFKIPSASTPFIPPFSIDPIFESLKVTGY